MREGMTNSHLLLSFETEMNRTQQRTCKKAGIESGFTAECEPEKYLRFAINSAIILPYIYGEAGLLSLKITEGGLDDVKRKCDTCCRLGSARLGSARLGSARRIAPFFQRVKSYFIQFITNQLPETGRIMPWLRLFAFAGRMVV